MSYSLAAGAPDSTPNTFSSGSVYVFSYDGSSWTQVDKLVPTNGNDLMLFGQSVSISHNQVTAEERGRATLRGVQVDNDGDMFAVSRSALPSVIQQ